MFCVAIVFIVSLKGDMFLLGSGISEAKFLAKFCDY